jgi:hypothetical protein
LWQGRRGAKFEEIASDLADLVAKSLARRVAEKAKAEKNAAAEKGATVGVKASRRWPTAFWQL